MSVPPLLLLMMLGAAALFASLIVDIGGAGRERLVGRARALAPAAGPRRGRTRALMRGGSVGRTDLLVQRLLPKPAELRARLDATGRPISFSQYATASAVLAMGAGLVAATMGMPALLALLEGLALGVWLPHFAVGFLGARRRVAFLKLFPDAIGLVVRGLKAGLPVIETVAVVGREIGDPVGEEFRKIAQQVRMGLPLEDAMWQTARRIALPEFNFLVISLSVQRETGGNLAETLENLETILRRRQQMRLKIKAMSSEATASALIIGSLPFVMAGLMLLVSGDYIRLLFTEPLGKLMLTGAALSLGVGALIMRKMVRFDI